MEQVANQCGSALIEISPESGEWALDGDRKHILKMSMPPLEGSARHRKAIVTQHEQLIASALEKLGSQTSNHLVIYSGSALPPQKRQLPDFDPEFDSVEDDYPTLDISTVADPADGGILQRYQLLTPALILTLLVVLFVMIPVLVLGISALASIQSPLRTEIPKGYNAQEKKVQ
ncbi:hypothetical protein ID866_1483 [Astraeus odoratus]|nr:hypothetical protein ID866_1483 [Astraeus odoratus]